MNTNTVRYPELVLKQNLYPVVVFLCTPRCGTQWIAKNLSEFYADQVVTEHEPVENEYYPKGSLGRYHLSTDLQENTLLNSHFNFIDDTVRSKSYIEVSWQSIAAIGEFNKRFEDRLKIVHLYRNPVKVAASLVTHNWYTGKIEDRYEKAELNPFDDGALLLEYREKWADLSFFEKSLYYWTEINLRALEIKQRYSEVPFYALKFEDLFEGTSEKSRITLIEFLAFLELKYDERMLEALDVKYDKYQYKSSLKMDGEKIHDHPLTKELAKKMGYHFDKDIDISRYKRDPLYKRAFRKLKSELTKIFGNS